ncbi:MAG: hypothetical protein Q9190_006439 [Brigantiaea leucoxantha]
MGADKRKSMKERTGELEFMIGQILQKLDTNGAAAPDVRLQSSEMKAAEALRCLRNELLPTTTLGVDVLQPRQLALQSPTSDTVDPLQASDRVFHNPPLLSLFDNAVLSSNVSDDPEGKGSKVGKSALTEKTCRVLGALRTLIPSAVDLGYILQSSQQSWRMWQNTNRGCSEVKLENLSHDQLLAIKKEVYEALLSDDVALVAKTLAVLSVSIQQLPRDFDYSRVNLPAPVEALKDHYVTSVETLLASDDGLVCTADGIHCMIVLSKFYVNMGKPRKSWLIIRRAICFAQMLGFHRQQPHNPADQEYLTKSSMWLQLFQMERYLSLFLGYPSCVSDAYFNDRIVDSEDCKCLEGERFMPRLAKITGQIIERNQNSESMTVATTLRIDQDLEDLKGRITRGWWETVPIPGTSFENLYDLFVTKMFYHTLRMYLHLPFMLKSATDRRYDFSRIAALESSREMITYYHHLRDPSRPLISVCNVIDFQVFTATMILVINLLGYSQSTGIHSPAQDEKDWKYVEGMAQALGQVARQESGHGEGSVAAQGFRLLEEFIKSRNGCRTTDIDHSYQAVIPYFGKIRIKWAKAFRGGGGGAGGGGVPPSGSNASSPRTSNLQGHNSSQIPTPPDSINTPFNYFSGPQVSFDTFFQPLPGDNNNQSWQDAPLEFPPTSVNDFELLDDWSWYDSGVPDHGVPKMGVL